MWFIWKERRDRVFEGKSKSVGSLVAEIQRHLDFWAIRKHKSVKNKGLLKNKKRNTWTSPKMNTLKINVDATWVSKDLPSGYAIILRNDADDIQGGREGQSSSTDQQEAEAVGVLQATIWAKYKGINNFSIEGDRESIFNYLQGHSQNISWCAKAYLDEANRIAKLCPNFLGFNYVPRLSNQVADVLSKYVRSLNSEVEWDNSPPVCILNQLSVDKFNVKRSQTSTLDGSTSSVLLAPRES
ncbi:uncharacterized protein LOC113295380 [Papaver somniferum]|uniref:uncharacterized protein LOC113295380 n=1 Tax=Papaver somniferum TaxID=3469 RepID=UPI000E701BDD|nr:uncharacterized protein LOC113295380 [Papaver somniferum]